MFEKCLRSTIHFSGKKTEVYGPRTGRAPQTANFKNAVRPSCAPSLWPGPSPGPYCQSTEQEASVTKAIVSLLRAAPRTPHSKYLCTCCFCCCRGDVVAQSKNYCKRWRPPETKEPVNSADWNLILVSANSLQLLWSLLVQAGSLRRLLCPTRWELTARGRGQVLLFGDPSCLFPPWYTAVSNFCVWLFMMVVL